jgi:hypothetical protein
VCPRLSYKQMDCFRVARNPSRVDAKRGDHFLQADFPLLIVVSERKIASECPTICPESFSYPHVPASARRQPTVYRKRLFFRTRLNFRERRLEDDSRRQTPTSLKCLGPVRSRGDGHRINDRNQPRAVRIVSNTVDLLAFHIKPHN